MMAFGWFFIATYRVYKKGISSCIQGHFYCGRTHLSECISAAWQCVGWTISKVKYKVHFSLTSNFLLKGKRRKHWLKNSKVKKEYERWTVSISEADEKVFQLSSEITWEFKERTVFGWMENMYRTYDPDFLPFFFKWVWPFLIIWLSSFNGNKISGNI